MKTKKYINGAFLAVACVDLCMCKFDSAFAVFILWIIVRILIYGVNYVSDGISDLFK